MSSISLIMNSVSDQRVRGRWHLFSITGSMRQVSFFHIGNYTKHCNRSDRKMFMKFCRRSASASNIRSITMVLSPIFFFVLFNTFTAIVSAQSTAVIRTSTGPVQGEILRTVVKGMKYSAFKGIPYAKPPLRYLRFKPPVPCEPWVTILNATTEGNDCPQVDTTTGNFTGDENCLFVNVFSPFSDLSKKPIKPKAVMVWIYGGSFKYGSSRTNIYGPDFLIEKDVIVVSFNYRIGALGFLAMNHRNATGNAGLKDQNLVLKWVRDNIAEFGGDPRKVTIFGQSAGGISADLHMLSDKSKALFQGVISMSGSSMFSWAFHSLEDAERLARKLGNLLGRKFYSRNTLLRYLYDVPACDIVMASQKITVLLPAFRPTIENPDIAEEAFTTMCSVNKYASGEFSKLPHITGFTAQETVTFASSLTTTLEIVNLATSIVEGIGMAVPSNIVITEGFFSWAMSVINGIKNGVTNPALQAVIDATTDIVIKYYIDEKQRYLFRYSSKPVYYYQITFDSSVSLHKPIHGVNFTGVGHGDDLPLLFYMPAANFPLDPSHPISITRERITRMWTNFAKYGNPTPDGKKDAVLKVTWPDSGFTGKHLDIGDELAIRSRPVSTMIRLMHLIGAPTAGARNGCPQSRGSGKGNGVIGGKLIFTSSA